TNTEFDSDMDDWTGDSAGQAFVWKEDSTGGCAEVTLSGAENSENRYQAVEQNGGHIQVTVAVRIMPEVGNDREDQLWLLFYRDGEIVHTEKMYTFQAIQSDDDFNLIYKAWLPAEIDKIGFYFRRVSGTGGCTYQVTQFKPEGVDVEKIYQI